MPKFWSKIFFRYQPVVFWLIFFFITLFCYFRTVNNYFVSDDWHWLWLSENLPWRWSVFWTNYEGQALGGSYNPLLAILWKFFYSIFGLRPIGYHIVSLFLHASNAWLVYRLAKKILAWAQVRASNSWSVLAGLLFLVWPTSVEAVAWLAAWPHLWATAFYLLTLLFYFKFRTESQKKFLFLGTTFFVCGLAVKEIVLSLPLVLILWEWYLYKNGHSSRSLLWCQLKIILCFLGIVIVFLILRQTATGTLIGYYGRQSLGWPLGEWLANMSAMLWELPTASYFRSLVYRAWYYRPLWAGVIFSLTIAIYFVYLYKFKLWLQATLFFCLLVSLLPVMPLGLHRITMSGERYLYLPLAFFIWWLVYLLAKIKLASAGKIFLIVFSVFCSSLIIYQKNIIWQEAAGLSRQIVASYSQLDLAPGQILLPIALPDNLSGAEVFRNNLQQALALNYPDRFPQILPLPIYLQLDRYNQQARLLAWRRDEKGWFGSSIGRRFVVTGITSITQHGLYFELRNYNYQNYLSNLIRLVPDVELKNKLETGEIKLLTFDRGILQLIQ